MPRGQTGLLPLHRQLSAIVKHHPVRLSHHLRQQQGEGGMKSEAKGHVLPIAIAHLHHI
jgi:hypothetical protein